MGGGKFWELRMRGKGHEGIHGIMLGGKISFIVKECKKRGGGVKLSREEKAASMGISGFD